MHLISIHIYQKRRSIPARLYQLPCLFSIIALSTTKQYCGKLANDIFLTFDILKEDIYTVKYCLYNVPHTVPNDSYRFWAVLPFEGYILNVADIHE